MIPVLNATLAIDARDKTGEAPVWDAGQARLLWSDIRLGIIHEAKPDGAGGWREIRRWDVGRPFGAALPCARGGFVLVAGTEIFMLDEGGHSTPFARLDVDPGLFSFNDAKCDARGRLWAGTYANDLRPGGGSLYRIDPDGSVTEMLDQVTGSNGLDWSPDGSTLYYIDSFKLTVDAFDFDMAQGTLSNRRTVVRIPHGEGLPDGMAVDRDGCLWIAVVGRSIFQYAPDGTVLRRVETSAPGVTSCAFGGADRGELFITSSALRPPDRDLLLLGFNAEMAEQCARAPGAGGLFVCRPGTSGNPAMPFAA